ncbi:MAG: terminase family protein, partial [Firmicutes bacterium]|nr:terminase family protein [Bacillota bacterium]
MDYVKKLRLRKIEEEIRFRKTNNKLELYNTGNIVHKKQMEFHESKKKNRWVFGGNRSGKTECGAVEVVWLARGIHPHKKNKKRTVGWVVSVSREVQRDVAQTKILHYLNKRWIREIVMHDGKKDFPEAGIIDYILIETKKGGVSKIGFKSLDQGREKFQGTSLDYVWFDEEPTEEVYRECKMRVLDKNGYIFGTMTPLKGLTFVYDEVYLNKNNSSEMWHIFMEWGDNPFLPKEAVEELTATLATDELESRRYGKFRASTGLVYTEFEETVHVIEPFSISPEWHDILSIDPGLNNPLACLFFAIDFDDNVYVIGEHYEAKKDIGYHVEKIFALAKSLGWSKFDRQNRLESFIDSAANQRTLASQKSVSELFGEQGILTNSRVNKDVFSGINIVKRYLDKRKIFIFKNCTNLIRELKSY